MDWVGCTCIATINKGLSPNCILASPSVTMALAKLARPLAQRKDGSQIRRALSSHFQTVATLPNRTQAPPQRVHALPVYPASPPPARHSLTPPCTLQPLPPGAAAPSPSHMPMNRFAMVLLTLKYSSSLLPYSVLHTSSAAKYSAICAVPSLPSRHRYT